MRHPPARDDGRRNLSPVATPARWLLIGSSRWHWAEQLGPGLRVWDDAAPVVTPAVPPQGWAAVGRVPAGPGLPLSRRISVADVPLAEAPPWLGVDRALAGWQAWRELGGGVLVADAGTVLSLTLVDGTGRFRGGRLMAGLALQLRAMAEATQGLPSLAPPWRGLVDDDDAWPAGTGEAMVTGVAAGLAAAVATAARQARAGLGGCRLVLSGGDGALLARRLLEEPGLGGEAPLLRPALCLAALARLRPAAPDTVGNQASPRSSST
jgi:type III pantothenate kinase